MNDFLHEPPLLRRSDVRLAPDPARTVLRPFTAGEPPERFANDGEARDARICRQLMSLTVADLDAALLRVLMALDERHRDLEARLHDRFEEIASRIPAASQATDAQRLLIGAYFTEEYAFESTALFNPSIVRHPDQDGLRPGDVRFVLSLRGIGEGHLSSLTFRQGTWRADGTVEVETPSRFAVGPTIRSERMANDRLRFHLGCGGARDVSEVAIYPFLPIQGRGIEDVRLVEFTDDDGEVTIRGTFTAFSGGDVRQGIIETADFRDFEMRGVEGDLYGGKGMALFPRKIGGRFAMLSRQDNEHVWLVYSDDLHRWSGGEKLLSPERPWEFIQLGNCGSPIEVDEGFLVLTHGVGGVRTYSVGAVLLDRDDPSRVLGRLDEPLLEPEAERDGYVPNVVYTCGALLRGRELLLPFAVADSYTRFATVRIDALLARMTSTEVSA